MSVESVKAFFQENGLAYDIREFDTSTENIELAARALGVEPERIAKTLSFKGKDRDILVVMKGDTGVDNKKFKQQFQVKAKMMSFEEVQEATGHPVGGVCPFGLRRQMDITLDVSLKQFETVYPAADSKNSCIEITPDDL